MSHTRSAALRLVTLLAAGRFLGCNPPPNSPHVSSATGAGGSDGGLVEAPKVNAGR